MPALDNPAGVGSRAAVRGVKPQLFMGKPLRGWGGPSKNRSSIAAILDTAHAELTLLRTQRTALDQQKRGLMPRLLTGKLPVKIA